MGPPPPDPTQIVNVRLKSSIVQKLDIVATAWGVKRSTALRGIVEGFIKDVVFEEQNRGGER